MKLYLEKCLELLYERACRCRDCIGRELCPTLDDIERVLIIVKQQNNAELAELLGLDQ